MCQKHCIVPFLVDKVDIDVDVLFMPCDLIFEQSFVGTVLENCAGNGRRVNIWNIEKIDVFTGQLLCCDNLRGVSNRIFAKVTIFRRFLSWCKNNYQVRIQLS